MINVDFKINCYLIIVILLKFRINCTIAKVFFILFDVLSPQLFQRRAKETDCWKG